MPKPTDEIKEIKPTPAKEAKIEKLIDSIDEIGSEVHQLEVSLAELNKKLSDQNAELLKTLKLTNETGKFLLSTKTKLVKLNTWQQQKNISWKTAFDVAYQKVDEDVQKIMDRVLNKAKKDVESFQRVKLEISDKKTAGVWDWVKDGYEAIKGKLTEFANGLIEIFTASSEEAKQLDQDVDALTEIIMQEKVAALRKQGSDKASIAYKKIAIEAEYKQCCPNITEEPSVVITSETTGECCGQKFEAASADDLVWQLHDKLIKNCACQRKVEDILSEAVNKYASTQKKADFNQDAWDVDNPVICQDCGRPGSKEQLELSDSCDWCEGALTKNEPAEGPFEYMHKDTEKFNPGDRLYASKKTADKIKAIEDSIEYLKKRITDTKEKAKKNPIKKNLVEKYEKDLAGFEFDLEDAKKKTAGFESIKSLEMEVGYVDDAIESLKKLLANKTQKKDLTEVLKQQLKDHQEYKKQLLKEIADWKKEGSKKTSSEDWRTWWDNLPMRKRILVARRLGFSEVVARENSSRIIHNGYGDDWKKYHEDLIAINAPEESAEDLQSSGITNQFINARPGEGMFTSGSKKVGSFSDSTWDKLEAMPEAKEFMRLHSQILNGGMQQLLDNEQGEWGIVKYFMNHSLKFIKQYAPEHFKEFEQILLEYSINADEFGAWTNRRNTGNSDIDDGFEENEDLITAWDEVDGKYYAIDDALGAELEKNINPVGAASDEIQVQGSKKGDLIGKEYEAFLDYLITRYENDLTYILQDNPFIHERKKMSDEAVESHYENIEDLLRHNPFIIKELVDTPEYREYVKHGGSKKKADDQTQTVFMKQDDGSMAEIDSTGKIVKRDKNGNNVGEEQHNTLEEGISQATQQGYKTSTIKRADFDRMKTKRQIKKILSQYGISAVVTYSPFAGNAAGTYGAFSIEVNSSTKLSQKTWDKVQNELDALARSAEDAKEIALDYANGNVKGWDKKDASIWPDSKYKSVINSILDQGHVSPSVKKKLKELAEKDELTDADKTYVTDKGYSKLKAASEEEYTYKGKKVTMVERPTSYLNLDKGYTEVYFPDTGDMKVVKTQDLQKKQASDDYTEGEKPTDEEDQGILEGVRAELSSMVQEHGAENVMALVQELSQYDSRVAFTMADIIDELIDEADRYYIETGEPNPNAEQLTAYVVEKIDDKFQGTPLNDSQIESVYDMVLNTIPRYGGKKEALGPMPGGGGPGADQFKKTRTKDTVDTEELGIDPGSPDEEPEDEEISNGDEVYIVPEYAGKEHGEAFTVSQCDGRRCWIGDEQGRGWYISINQLTHKSPYRSQPRRGSKKKYSSVFKIANDWLAGGWEDMQEAEKWHIAGWDSTLAKEALSYEMYGFSPEEALRYYKGSISASDAFLDYMEIDEAGEHTLRFPDEVKEDEPAPEQEEVK